MFTRVKIFPGLTILAVCFLLAVIIISWPSKPFDFISELILPRVQPAQAALDGAGSGLVGWWKFDEGSGTTAGDSSGSGSAGTLINGPTWNTADYKVGAGAMNFDGVNDYIALSTNSSLNITGPITMVGWMKLTSTAQKVFFGGYSSVTSAGYSLGTSIQSSDGRLWYFSGQVGTWRAGNATYNDGKWHQFAVSVTGTVCSFYKDGIFDTTNTLCNIPDSYSGVRAIGSVSNGTSNFNGSLDDVRIYNRALTSQEISDLYALGSGTVPPPPSPVNGSCSTTLNVCTTGSLIDTTDSSTNYLWSCTGSNGGTTAQCSLPIPQSDTTPPTISSIQSTSITTTGATILWTTNEPSDTQIDYGLTTNYGSQTAIVSQLSTSHLQQLTGFIPNTTYHYMVRGRDGAGNLATSVDQTFVTSPLVVNASGNIYIGQADTGDMTGSDCSNIHSVTWFNTATNWGTTAGKIGPGTTVHLCGTISTALTIHGSGTVGNPISVLFEKDSKMSAPAWTGIGAISCNAMSYITIDGGSNGKIENTDNGTLLGQQVNSVGLSAKYCNNLEVKNLTITNIYQVSDGDYRGYGLPVSIFSGSHVLVHDNKVDGGDTCLGFAYHPVGGKSVDFDIYNNTVLRCANGITFGSGAANSQADDIRIHDNRIDQLDKWDFHFFNPGDANFSVYHTDGIQVWADHGGDTMTNLQIYNNVIGPRIGRVGTVRAPLGSDSLNSYIFTEGQIGVGEKIYNNLLFAGVGTGLPNGFIQIRGFGLLGDLSGSQNVEVYNNTIVSYSSGAVGVGLSENASVIAKNNIFYSVGVPVYFAGGASIVGFDNNIYFQDAVSYREYRIGFDQHSIYADPQFVDVIGGDYHLKNTSPAINKGIDLSQYFNVDKDGVSRPQGVTWDIGAYEYVSGGTPSPVNGSCLPAGQAGSATLNTCTAGAFSDLADTSTNYLWNCTGTNGGSTANCSLTIPLSPDITLPTVAITSPLNNAAITGSISLSASASDPIVAGQAASGIVSVQFKLDNVNIGQELTTAPYSGAWNTVGVANGIHTLTAIARDQAGNRATSTLIAITVSNTAKTPAAPAAPAPGVFTPTVEQPKATSPSPLLRKEGDTIPLLGGQDAQLRQILLDAAAVWSGNVQTILANAKVSRSLTLEKTATDKYLNGLTNNQAGLISADASRLNYFLAYGTVSSRVLGGGERAGALNSYKSAFSKLPKTEADWQDVLKIANGRWPSQRSNPAEAKAKLSFKQIYGREAKMANANDSNAITIMAYGLRPSQRNLKSEKAAILSFRHFLKRAPSSAVDWDVVRAVAYSGAKR